MDNLANDLVDVINKNLPQATAAQLQKYLAQAEEDAERLALLEKDTAAQKLKITELQRQILNQTDLDKKLADLDAKIKDVEKRERDLTIIAANNRAEIAQSRYDTAMQVMGMVFKNQEIRTTVQRSVTPGAPPVQPHGGNNYTSSPAQIGNEYTTTSVEQA